MAFSFPKKSIQQGIACEMQSKFYSASNNKKSGMLNDVLVGGSQTSILTSYLESAGLLTLGVKFSSKSVQPLQRYCNLQTHSKEGMENVYFGNPSYLMA